MGYVRILQHENAKLMKECKKITKFMPLGREKHHI